MDVGGGGVTALAQATDGLVALDGAAYWDVSRAEVCVGGFDSSAVVEDNDLPVSTLRARKGDDTVGGGDDGGAHRGGDVDAFVEFALA